MKKSIIIFAVIVLFVLACGCTQSPPVQPVATPTPSPTQALKTPHATVATPQAILTTGSVSPTIKNSVSDNTIHINKKGFDPASITVNPGTTVRWVNEDSTSDAALYNPTHRIALVNFENSPLLSPGQSWSRIFTQPGTYDYSDMIHTALQGTVIVV